MEIIKKAQEDKTTLILLSVVCFLVGLVLGFVLSSAKNGFNGIVIGSYNSGNGCDNGCNNSDMNKSKI